MTRRLQLTAFAALVCALVACQGRAPEASATKIINGTVQNTPNGAVQPVEQGGDLACTSTFVGQRTAITAGHCVVPTAGSSCGVTVNGVTPVNCYFYQTFYDAQALGLSDTAHDVAVLLFPAGTASSLGITSFPALPNRQPYVGERVTIVGYGDNDEVNHTGAGTKRAGFNSVSGVYSDAITLDGYTTGGDSGEGAVPDHGDSGGPMINSSYQIAGVVSNGVAVGSLWHTTYFNVYSNEGLGIIRDAATWLQSN